jgi:hypothetical protein
MSDNSTKRRNYIRVFEPEGEARLEQRRAEAEIEFRRGYQRLTNSGNVTEEGRQRLVVQYASARFFAYSRELLQAEVVDTAMAPEFIGKALFAAIEEAFLTKHRAALRADRKQQRIRFHELARSIITNSPQWLELQEALVERAKAEQEAIIFVRQAQEATIAFMAEKRQAKADVVEITSLAKPETRTEVVDTTPLPQPEIRTRRGRPRKVPNHHLEVEGYLDDVSKFAKNAQHPYPGLQRGITIADFCLVSGFKDDTVFGAWRRDDKKRCPDAHARRFEATLKLKPLAFLERLNQACR